MQREHGSTSAGRHRHGATSAALAAHAQAPAVNVATRELGAVGRGGPGGNEIGALGDGELRDGRLVHQPQLRLVQCQRRVPSGKARRLHRVEDDGELGAEQPGASRPCSERSDRGDPLADSGAPLALATSTRSPVLSHPPSRFSPAKDGEITGLSTTWLRRPRSSGGPLTISRPGYSRPPLTTAVRPSALAEARTRAFRPARGLRRATRRERATHRR
jgi:hypothetical protein